MLPIRAITPCLITPLRHYHFTMLICSAFDNDATSCRLLRFLICASRRYDAVTSPLLYASAAADKPMLSDIEWRA